MLSAMINVITSTKNNFEDVKRTSKIGENNGEINGGREDPYLSGRKRT